MSVALEFVKSVNGPDALNGVRPDLVVIEPEEDKEITISQKVPDFATLYYKSWIYLHILSSSEHYQEELDSLLYYQL